MPSRSESHIATAAIAINANATPMSRARWVIPARSPSVFPSSIAARLVLLLLGQEAGLGHELLVGRLRRGPPVAVFLARHERGVEGALRHEVLPLLRLAHLLEHVDV